MPKKKDKNGTLKQLYYTPKEIGSLGGVQRFQGSLFSKGKKYKKRTIYKWLQSQDAYTLHKPVRRTFKRRRTVVSGLNDQFQADLIDMKSIKSDNDGHSFILTVIDVFSKYGWAKPLRSKSGAMVAKALQKIFQERKCRVLQTDKGTEFYNQHVKQLLTQYDVTHFSTENDDIKCACVERFNQTLQTKLYRWFTKTNSHQWVNILDDLIYSYNNSFHRSISMKPINVTSENEEDVWLKLYSDIQSPPILAKFKVGDSVRISKYKHVFSKGYDANWSTEVFTIEKVNETNPITYKLCDSLHEKIYGSYYEKELQKVTLPKQFLVENVIANRQKGKKTEYYVKFKGYPSKFNAWVDKSSVKLL